MIEKEVGAFKKGRDGARSNLFLVEPSCPALSRILIFSADMILLSDNGLADIQSIEHINLYGQRDEVS